MGVGELTKLSVSEILRAANHDFINQLQLIKMNLDLNRIDDAKKSSKIIAININLIPI